MFNDRNRHGIFTPVFADMTESVIKHIVYHCQVCMHGWIYQKQLGRCIYCGTPIDFTDLRELEKKYKWI